MMNKPKRGEIYWIDFSELEGDNKSSGTEINGKERPALVVSINWYNRGI
ncbi:MAG: type II toxin-antitoxin system PemK/MazF family toxin [Candidatus Moeniiplasma glomeromycotorum]|nr:type II toxin-antitoxin system PemK/MazF family toxin [Candidatus Moeniiplasma glomeromycotorum]MCE8169314.1 type II toxin-antitoxin system PemK/MazF family toxin [Candidatus Moeniiplasma glomeromycotorum]